jgi:hypothetical protein
MRRKIEIDPDDPLATAPPAIYSFRHAENERQEWGWRLPPTRG